MPHIYLQMERIGRFLSVQHQTNHLFIKTTDLSLVQFKHKIHLMQFQWRICRHVTQIHSNYPIIFIGRRLGWDSLQQRTHIQNALMP